jgi:hypothetical protein
LGNGSFSAGPQPTRLAFIALVLRAQPGTRTRTRKGTDAIVGELEIYGTSELQRIVSKLAWLIQRTATVAEEAFEDEYEYRDAEYDYERNT